MLVAERSVSSPTEIVDTSMLEIVPTISFSTTGIIETTSSLSSNTNSS